MFHVEFLFSYCNLKLNLILLLNWDLFVALIETICSPLGSRHNANGEIPMIESSIIKQYKK